MLIISIVVFQDLKQSSTYWFLASVKWKSSREDNLCLWSMLQAYQQITMYIINSLIATKYRVLHNNVDVNLKEISNKDHQALKRTQSQPSISHAFLRLQVRHSLTPFLEPPRSPSIGHWPLLRNVHHFIVRLACYLVPQTIHWSIMTNIINSSIQPSI